MIKVCSTNMAEYTGKQPKERGFWLRRFQGLKGKKGIYQGLFIFKSHMKNSSAFFFFSSGMANKPWRFLF